MSHEWIMRMLASLGFSPSEAEIYLFLAQTGNLPASDIAARLKIKRQQLYPCLTTLQARGCIKAIPEQPAKFSAVPIENVIDTLVKTDLEEAQTQEQNRQRILAYWQELIKKNSTSSTKR